jgi:hypothetical protein
VKLAVAAPSVTDRPALAASRRATVWATHGERVLSGTTDLAPVAPAVAWANVETSVDVLVPARSQRSVEPVGGVKVVLRATDAAVTTMSLAEVVVIEGPTALPEAPVASSSVSIGTTPLTPRNVEIPPLELRVAEDVNV